MATIKPSMDNLKTTKKPIYLILLTVSVKYNFLYIICSAISVIRNMTTDSIEMYNIIFT